MYRTATTATAMPAKRSAYTSCVGRGAYWTSAPQASAPSASPPTGTTLLTRPASRGEVGGLRSTSAAPSAVTAAPVAMPWAKRASISSGTPLAPMKMTSDTDSSAIAAASTGRRPMWSESAPTISNAPSSPTM